MALSLDDIRSYSLGLDPGVTEDMPFGDDVLVFRTGGKIFLLANLVSVPFQMNLKCEPERASELREKYDAVIPGYHMNKRHWNTVILDGRIPSMKVYEMIDHSFGLVRTKRRTPPTARKKKRPQKGR